VALSDACFDFMDTVRSATRELARAVEQYAKSPLDYGNVVDALRRACAEVADARWDPEAAVRVIRLATSVLAYHDTLPDDPALAERQAQMARLIEILRSDLDQEDAAEVERIIPDVVNETSLTKRAALRLKQILPKLGKASYDIAVSVISDIASETAKKILGLKP
jgi:hypothetical protein